MPTLKKSIKAVRDALKETERQTERERSRAMSSKPYWEGKASGLRLASQIIDQVFPQ